MRIGQPSYAAGVLAPSLHARIDLAKWHIGLAEANNMLVDVHGGIANRPGMRYDGTSLGPSRLIPFEYSFSETYVLEFTDYKLRFLRDEAFVVHPATRAYAEAVIFDGDSDVINWGAPTGDWTTDTQHSVVSILDYQSGAGQLYTGLGLYVDNDGTIAFTFWDNSIGDSAKLTVPTIALSDSTDYTIEMEWYKNGSNFLEARFTIDGGSNWYTVTCTDVNDTPLYDQATWESNIWSGEGEYSVALFSYTDDTTPVFSLTPSLDGSMYDSVGDGYVYNRYQSSNKFPLEIVAGTEANPDSGNIVEIDSPFAYADLKEVRFIQREAVLYMVHPDYGEYVLVRYNYYQWWFNPTEWVPNISAPLNVVGDYTGNPTSGFYIEYMVAAINAEGEESIPSAIASVPADPSSTWELGKHVDLSWDAVSSADLYVVYKSTRGYFGYIGSTTDTSFIDDNIEADSTDGPKVLRDYFSGTDNQPGAVGIYQQRKVYGRTNNKPQTTWMTVSGTMDNTTVSRPLKDDDAIEAQLDSNQVNEILHFVAMKNLVVVTTNGVWTLSGYNNEAITPTNLRYELESSIGGSYLRPIVTGNTLLVVPSYRKGVREMFFQIQANGFEGSDLEILANHLFIGDTIIDWAFQRDEKRCWCVMESGRVNVLTYLREHEVVAWTTVDTTGSVEAVCVIRNNSRDVVYFSVLRTIDSSPVRYIESLTERLPDNVLEDGVFLDAAISYDGAPATIFSGATHLANETCNVLADGNVITGVEVDGSGGFTLDAEYSTVHIGIPYLSDFETLDLDYNAKDGPGFPLVKNLAGVVLMLENTRGIAIGPNEDNLDEAAFRTDEDYDEPTRLFTGKLSVSLEPDWNSNGRVHVRQSNPLPVTILAHFPDFESSDF